MSATQRIEISRVRLQKNTPPPPPPPKKKKKKNLMSLPNVHLVQRVAAPKAQSMSPRHPLVLPLWRTLWTIMGQFYLGCQCGQVASIDLSLYLNLDACQLPKCVGRHVWERLSSGAVRPFTQDVSEGRCGQGRLVGRLCPFPTHTRCGVYGLNCKEC